MCMSRHTISQMLWLRGRPFFLDGSTSVFDRRLFTLGCQGRRALVLRRKCGRQGMLTYDQTQRGLAPVWRGDDMSRATRLRPTWMPSAASSA